MISFKEFLIEGETKWQGTFCYHKETHHAKSSNPNKEAAFITMCVGLSKKIGRPVEKYFRSTPNSYSLKEVK